MGDQRDNEGPVVELMPETIANAAVDRLVHHAHLSRLAKPDALPY
jgi:hypothetical protein